MKKPWVENHGGQADFAMPSGFWANWVVNPYPQLYTP